MGEKMRLSGLWVFFFLIKLKIEGEEFQGTLKCYTNVVTGVANKI